MENLEYLGNEEYALTTSLSNITVPSGLSRTARVLSLGCRYDGEFVEWEMAAVGGTDTEIFPAYKMGLNCFNAAPGQIIFKASTVADTGTLQIGFWG